MTPGFPRFVASPRPADSDFVVVLEVPSVFCPCGLRSDFLPVVNKSMTFCDVLFNLLPNGELLLGVLGSLSVVPAVFSLQHFLQRSSMNIFPRIEHE